MKKYLPVERSHARTIQQSYRCAACWNPVMVGFDKDGDWIECVTEGCRLPGLVSAKWVERQLAENEAEAVTVRQILKDSVEWLSVEIKDKVNRAQAIKELGF